MTSPACTVRFFSKSIFVICAEIFGVTVASRAALNVATAVISFAIVPISAFAT